MSAVADAAARSAKLNRRNRPRLAVLTPVFNDQEGLERSLASLAQDGAEFDVFVVDDGSEPHIRIPPALPYFVQLIRQDRNQGITHALNAGLKAISEFGHEYIARLDAGDVSLPGRLPAQAAYLDAHPECAAVGTAAEYVSPAGLTLFVMSLPLDHAGIIRRLRYGTAIIHSSVMLRNQAVTGVGGYKDTYEGGEDQELFFALARHHKFANLPDVYLKVEVKPVSITARRRRLVWQRLRILADNFNPISIHSYLGFAGNVASLAVPRGAALFLHRLFRKVRAE